MSTTTLALLLGVALLVIALAYFALAQAGWVPGAGGAGSVVVDTSGTSGQGTGDQRRGVNDQVGGTTGSVGGTGGPATGQTGPGGISGGGAGAGTGTGGGR